MIVEEFTKTIEQDYVTLRCRDCQKEFIYSVNKSKQSPKDWPYPWVKWNIGNIPFYVYDAVFVFSIFRNGQWICNRCKDEHIVGD